MRQESKGILPVTLLGLLFSITPATAQQAGPEVRSSPDGQELVCWFDHDAGDPVGKTRSILARSKSDPDMPLFSFAGASRSTDAAWNAVSTRCVIINEVDWERTLVWLVYKDKPGKWHERSLDVMAPIEAAYRQAVGNKDQPGFLAHLEKIEWISETQLRFLVWSNRNDPDLASSGSYQVEINTELPDAKPTVTRVEAAADPSRATFKPENGFVPDANTAIKIAVAVWEPIYGEAEIAGEKPYLAELMNGIWTVRGSHPKGTPGGTAIAEISKDDGKIVRVIHEQ